MVSMLSLAFLHAVAGFTCTFASVPAFSGVNTFCCCFNSCCCGQSCCHPCCCFFHVTGIPVVAGVALVPDVHCSWPSCYCWCPWCCWRSRCYFRPCCCWHFVAGVPAVVGVLAVASVPADILAALAGVSTICTVQRRIRFIGLSDYGFRTVLFFCYLTIKSICPTTRLPCDVTCLIKESRQLLRSARLLSTCAVDEIWQILPLVSLQIQEPDLLSCTWNKWMKEGTHFLWML